MPTKITVTAALLGPEDTRRLLDAHAERDDLAMDLDDAQDEIARLRRALAVVRHIARARSYGVQSDVFRRIVNVAAGALEPQTTDEDDE